MVNEAQPAGPEVETMPEWVVAPEETPDQEWVVAPEQPNEEENELEKLLKRCGCGA